jgi:hypothetical protein
MSADGYGFDSRVVETVLVQRDSQLADLTLAANEIAEVLHIDSWRVVVDQIDFSVRRGSSSVSMRVRYQIHGGNDDHHALISEYLRYIGK